MNLGRGFSQSAIMNRQLKCITLVYNIYKIKYETRIQIYESIQNFGVTKIYQAFLMKIML